MFVLRRFMLVVVLVISTMAANGARADAISSVLNILYTAGLVDGAVVQAEPLIRCLAGGGSVTQCGQQAANQQADAYLAGDPMVKLVVDVILAAQAQRWFDVLELTGADLLLQVTCKAGIPGGGPVKDFICGGVFAQVAKLAKPVVREVLISVRDQEWLRLITMLGPDLACMVIPDSVPLKKEICGPLAAVLMAAAEVVGDAAGALKDLATKAYEAVDGQSPHMSYDEFYRRFIIHSLHTRVMERLVQGRTGLGLNPDQWNYCVRYFDNHEQALDTAKKTCTDLGNRLHREAELLVKAIEPAPEAYYASHLKQGDLLRNLAAEKFGGNLINQHKSYIYSVQPGDYRYGSMQSAPIGNDLKQPYLDCMNDMQARFPLPNSVESLSLPNAWNWVCWNAVGRSFANDLVIERLRLAIPVTNSLKGVGCLPDSGTSLAFQCDNVLGYQTCRQTFDGYRYTRCRANSIVSNTALGEQLAAQLGRRCNFLATSKEGYNDPRVVCTRPWKQAECQQRLAQAKADPQQPQWANSIMKCNFADLNDYQQARQRATAILAALNGPAPSETQAEPPASSGSTGLAGRLTQAERSVQASTAANLAANIQNCTATWDPLALRCLSPAVLASLPERLPGATLYRCAPDPRKDGADVPCYNGEAAANPPAASVSNLAIATNPIRDLRVKALPDLVAVPQFQLAGQSVTWGGTATLDAGTLRRTALGPGCLASVTYGVENRGKAMSAAAARDRWQVAGRSPDVFGEVGRIAAGATRQQTLTLTLHPGVNQVSLTVDPEGRIEEEDEGNNSTSVKVTLTGQCSTAGALPSLTPIRPGLVPPAAPTGRAGERVPITRPSW